MGNPVQNDPYLWGDSTVSEPLLEAGSVPRGDLEGF